MPVVDPARPSYAKARRAHISAAGILPTSAPCSASKTGSLLPVRRAGSPSSSRCALLGTWKSLAATLGRGPHAKLPRPSGSKPPGISLVPPMHCAEWTSRAPAGLCRGRGALSEFSVPLHPRPALPVALSRVVSTEVPPRSGHLHRLERSLVPARFPSVAFGQRPEYHKKKSARRADNRAGPCCVTGQRITIQPLLPCQTRNPLPTLFGFEARPFVVRAWRPLSGLASRRSSLDPTQVVRRQSR